MKKLILIAAPLCLVSSAHASLLAHWNFNTLTASTNNGTSYASTSGSGVLNLTGWTTTGSSGITSFSGSTVNAVGGDVSGQALALQGGTTSGTPNNGAQMIIQISTLGYEDLVMSFATQKTSSGFTSNQFAYSTDGVSYTDFGSPYNPATSYAVQSFDLSTVTATDNAANVWLRITFSGATGNSGNNRIDNIQLNATDAIPEPATMTILAGAAAMAALRRRKK